jgi:pimeloyl-ACP methyl ester carboxylesterase
MRLPRTHVPVAPPTVDEVAFRDLYRKSEYPVETADGWTLIVTRYEPAPQPFHQPLLGEPLLLVHGFSQNRHTWTSGEFVKNLLYFGLDIHIVELRGHGKSNAQLQHERSESTGRPLPPDLDYGWDADDYLLHDLPAATAAVKARTGRRRVFYVGHSMGGMLGYGYAGLHDDLEGLVTIGAPRTSAGASFCSASSRSPRPSPARSSTPG